MKFFASCLLAPDVQLSLFKQHFKMGVFVVSFKFKPFLRFGIDIINRGVFFCCLNFLIGKKILLKFVIAEFLLQKRGVVQNFFGTGCDFFFFVLLGFERSFGFAGGFQLFGETGIVGFDHFKGFGENFVISLNIASGNFVCRI